MSALRSVLAELWRLAGCDPAALEHVGLTGAEPILPGRFKVGTAAAASIAASGLAAAELWRLRTGRAQAVSVDMRAAAAAFRSERYLHLDGRRVHEGWAGIHGFYRAGDGRWVQLQTKYRR